MTVQHFTPEGMLQPTPYHHVAVGTGSTHVHVSGQIARRADGTPVAPAISPGRSPRRCGTRVWAWPERAPRSRTCCG